MGPWYNVVEDTDPFQQWHEIERIYTLTAQELKEHAKPGWIDHYVGEATEQEQEQEQEQETNQGDGQEEHYQERSLPGTEANAPA